MRTWHLITFALLFFQFPALYSQKAPAKFGKANPEELKITHCPFDSTAQAYYLFDFGETALDGGSSIRLVTRRHFRIKVIGRDGVGLANQSIRVFSPDRDNEFLQGIKAIAYNLDAGGQVTESRMEKSAVFKERSSENYVTYKFAVPNVRPGTVFEVSYELHSDYITFIDSWIFQHDYPTQRSEFHAGLYDDFEYRRTVRGFLPIDATQTKGHREIIVGGRSMSLDETTDHFVGENLPAFKVEPFLYTDDNYRSAVHYHLVQVSSSSGYFRKVAANWGEVGANLLDHEYFGGLLRKKSPFRDLVAGLKSLASEETRMTAIFQLVKDYYQWDGKLGLYASESLGNAFESRKTNAAGINLALIGALREAGLKADPLVLSTRDNGMIMQGQCSANLLNQVIACVMIDTLPFYLDASDPYATTAMMPAYNFNGLSIVMGNKDFRAVQLQQRKVYQTESKLEVVLDKDGRLQGEGTLAYHQYAAHHVRHEVASAGDKDAWLKDKSWHQQLGSAAVQNAELSGLDSLDQSVRLRFNGAFEGMAETAGNLLLIKPWVFELYRENPLKSEERYYPVEFDYPLVETAVLKLTVPEGYTVETLPKGIRMKIPDGSAKFTFNATQNGNVILCNSVFQISHLQYSPEEYQHLRLLFQAMVDKQQENIVLKKA